jgi:hypothetical protein
VPLSVLEENVERYVAETRSGGELSGPRTEPGRRGRRRPAGSGPCRPPHHADPGGVLGIASNAVGRPLRSPQSRRPFRRSPVPNGCPLASAGRDRAAPTPVPTRGSYAPDLCDPVKRSRSLPGPDHLPCGFVTCGDRRRPQSRADARIRRRRRRRHHPPGTPRPRHPRRARTPPPRAGDGARAAACCVRSRSCGACFPSSVAFLRDRRRWILFGAPPPCRWRCIARGRGASSTRSPRSARPSSSWCRSSPRAPTSSPSPTSRSSRGCTTPSRPCPSRQIEAVIHRRWVVPRPKCSTIDREPIAAASLGQVHRARSNGRTSWSR